MQKDFNLRTKEVPIGKIKGVKKFKDTIGPTNILVIRISAT